MKNFLLTLLETISFLFFFLIVWLIIKYTIHITFFYPLVIISILSLHFLKSSFIEILVVSLSIFLGFLCFILLPKQLYQDKIIIALEMLGLLVSYFIILDIEETYEKQKISWIERKENLEKEIALLNVNIEATKYDISHCELKVKNYKLLAETIHRLSSFDNIKSLKKYVIETMHHFVANCNIKFNLFEEDNRKKEECQIEERILKKCDKEKNFLYIHNISDWLDTIDDFHLKKYLQKQKALKSLLCLKLTSPNEQEDLGYIICYSESLLNDDIVRLFTMLASYISISLVNIKSFEKLKELAITDSLTGLYVQKYFKEILSEEIKRAQHYNRRLSIAIFDIDNFKSINDTYGHNIGDEVLVKFANILKTRLRETDVISRYGGDEFAVIFPDTSGSDAYKICEEIRNMMQQEVILISKEINKFFKSSQRFKVSISCGVCEYKKDFHNEEEYINFVDKLLYKAKTTGKNKVIIC